MSPVLAREEVRPRGDRPRRWSWFLHGIFGAGRNWRSVARRLVEDEPDRGALLLDLRLHGDSTGMPGPHTVAACGRDLEDTAENGAPRPDRVVGHSFGGKVALAHLDQPGEPPSGVWVVDCPPSAREPEGDAIRLLEVLEREPGPFGAREEAVEAVRRHGFSERVARFMATNLEQEGDALRWRLDREGVESLLMDFFHTDLWSVVQDPPGETVLHFVQATGSDALREEECRRIEAAGEAHGRARLHRVAGGHWLNVSNPEGLLELMRGEVSR